MSGGKLLLDVDDYILTCCQHRHHSVWILIVRD